MYGAQLPVVDLYHALLDYGGDDSYSDVLEPWTDGNSEQVRWIADFEQRTNDDWSAATGEDVCRLYALFRVTSIMLLRFQSGRADGSDYPGPAIDPEGLQLFLERLGFYVPDTKGYHPFYHEMLSQGPATFAPRMDLRTTRHPCQESSHERSAPPKHGRR